MDNNSHHKKVNILIVDDSAAVRSALSDIISGTTDLSVMATASDPYVAAKRMQKEIPDVIILDIEMPRMDGLTFLRKIMAQHPIPVVICSTITEKGSAAFFEALEAGAVDVIAKPRIDTSKALKETARHVCHVLRAASHSRVGYIRNVKSVKIEKKINADAIISPISLSSKKFPETDKIIAIGASTGGTEALRAILLDLPEDVPGIVVVQHMPEKFTNAFAHRLDALCRVSVKEAVNGDVVKQGSVLIAPGNYHLLLQRTQNKYRTTIKDGPHVSRHRPSVDVLFRSVAQTAGPNALGILLTGMGDDGAHGMLEMRTTGANTIAQDEESSVVFGMPKEAILLGGAVKTLNLKKIASEIIKFAKQKSEVSRT